MYCRNSQSKFCQVFKVNNVKLYCYNFTATFEQLHTSMNWSAVTRFSVFMAEINFMTTSLSESLWSTLDFIICVNNSGTYLTKEQIRVVTTQSSLSESLWSTLDFIICVNNSGTYLTKEQIRVVTTQSSLSESLWSTLDFIICVNNSGTYLTKEQICVANTVKEQSIEPQSLNYKWKVL